MIQHGGDKQQWHRLLTKSAMSVSVQSASGSSKDTTATLSSSVIIHTINQTHIHNWYDRIIHINIFHMIE